MEEFRVQSSSSEGQAAPDAVGRAPRRITACRRQYNYEDYSWYKYTVEIVNISSSTIFSCLNLFIVKKLLNIL